MKEKPNKSEFRASVLYVRQQFRTMFPKRKPWRHPAYRSTVIEIAQHAADIRQGRMRLAAGRRGGKKTAMTVARIASEMK
jgi:hypothetical protein